jgi:hypothetical protein
MEIYVRLGIPGIIRLKQNAPEFDYSSFLRQNGYWKTNCFEMEVEGPPECIRTPVHELILCCDLILSEFSWPNSFRGIWHTFVADRFGLLGKAPSLEARYSN